MMYWNSAFNDRIVRWNKIFALAAAEQIDKQEDRALLLADLQTLELESRVP